MSHASKVDKISDPARLQALQRLEIGGSDPVKALEDLTNLVSALFDMGKVSVHILDDRQQWVKAMSEHGHTVTPRDRELLQVPVTESFCQYALEQTDVLIMPALSNDERFANNALVTGPAAIRFYAGVPLQTEEGHAIGTLCLMDSRPYRELNQQDLAMLQQFGQLTVNIIENSFAHENMQRHLRNVLEEDSLTGLASQQGVLTYLQRLCGNFSDNMFQVGIIKIRLKRTNRIKLGRGTEVFNRLLQNVANQLHEIRDAEEFLGRLEDNSFLIARTFTSMTDRSGTHEIDEWADQRAKEVISCLGEPFTAYDETFHITPSIGIARSSDDGHDAYTLLESADIATLRAENASDERLSFDIRWSDHSVRSTSDEHLSLEQRLRSAVASEQFTVVYQPIVNLQHRNEVAGAEALVRWPQSDGPTIGPNVFIPLLEDLGLIHDVGLFVFETACRTLRMWHDNGHPDLWMSINLSPYQLNDPDLVESLHQLAADSGIEPRRIKLEVTESTLSGESEHSIEVLNGLTEAGFPLSLDDFGTGYSSLGRLIQLPFSVLKVDRSFVSDCPRGPGSAVVASLAQLTCNLELDAVGEGVETFQEEQFLRSVSYPFAQGYRYARPLTDEAFLNHVTDTARSMGTES